MQTAIPYMQLRGGSSKGLYFNATDLPEDIATRDAVLLAAMGGSDPRQIDGLGGADPLTSKVAIVSRSNRPDSDVDYLFAQVVVGEGRVDTTPNCGNILTGVGPFAIEAGLVHADQTRTTVRVHMLNSGNRCKLEIVTPDGRVSYEGEARIDGVPGTSAPIFCEYLDIAGSASGNLLPTGTVKDEIDGIAVTCIDNGMPVVVMRAMDLGITGRETPEQLDSDSRLRERLESIRLAMGPRMNLGDVIGKVIPKMSLVSAPVCGGTINTRTFIPHRCHSAVGVLGAVSVATACVLPGAVCSDLAVIPEGSEKVLSIEHPSGEFKVQLEMDNSEKTPRVTKASVLRTARLLSMGSLFVPVSVWAGHRGSTTNKVMEPV